MERLLPNHGLFVAIVALFAGAIGQGACLPDLAAPRVEDEGGTAVLTAGCGDGLIATFDDGGDAGESCDPGDAAAPGCVDCHVACEGRLDPVSGHCYFTVGTHAGYQDGESLCQAAASHVVTIDSAGEVALVDAVANSASYWVGLEFQPTSSAFEAPQGVNEPGWPQPPDRGPCNGCFGLGIDGGGFSPAPGVDASATAGCVIAENGTWFSVPCRDVRTYTTVCEREPRGQRAQFCGGGLCFTLPATAGKKRYILFTSSDSEDVAVTTCLSLGGHLVGFDSREEREQLAREVLEILPLDATLSPTRTFWIGAARADGGVFAWDDGIDRTIPWGDEQPSANGARAFLRLSNDYDTGLAYVDDGTAAARPYVCERPPE